LFEEPGYCACIEYEEAGSIHLLQASKIKLSKEAQVVADVTSQWIPLNIV
jgi:hypothetical protein